MSSAVRNFFEGLGYQKMTELLLSNGVNAIHAVPYSVPFIANYAGSE